MAAPRRGCARRALVRGARAAVPQSGAIPGRSAPRTAAAARWRGSRLPGAMAPDHHVVEHAHRAEERQVLERAADAERGDTVARQRKERCPGEGNLAALAVVEA